MANVIVLALAACALAVYGAIAWVVLAKYRNSGNVGYLVLGAGVLVWPVLTWLIGVSGLTMFEVFVSLPVNVTMGEFVAALSFSSRVIQGGLILLGILLIGRRRSEAEGVTLEPTHA